MSRALKLYIEDILDSIAAIEEFTCDLTFNEFEQDRKTYSATIREFITVGEAISKIIDELEKFHPSYPWRSIKNFRNIVVHEYFGVDSQIVWDLVQNEPPQLKKIIKEFYASGGIR